MCYVIFGIGYRFSFGENYKNASHTLLPLLHQRKIDAIHHDNNKQRTKLVRKQENYNNTFACTHFHTTFQHWKAILKNISSCEEAVIFILKRFTSSTISFHLLGNKSRYLSLIHVFDMHSWRKNRNRIIPSPGHDFGHSASATISYQPQAILLRYLCGSLEILRDLFSS